MMFLPLLGKMLKDDEMIEILEGSDIEVIYEFDRLHENVPDVYWASSKPQGFQFRFDGSQRLDVVFLHVVPGDGYAAVSQHDCDVTFFGSKAGVEAFGEAQQLHVIKGSADFLGVIREWVRLGFASHSIHYEFRAGSPAMVSISRIDQPAA
jgi:hypothetical protein